MNPQSLDTYPEIPTWAEIRKAYVQKVTVDDLIADHNIHRQISEENREMVRAGETARANAEAEANMANALMYETVNGDAPRGNGILTPFDMHALRAGAPFGMGYGQVVDAMNANTRRIGEEASKEAQARVLDEHPEYYLSRNPLKYGVKPSDYTGEDDADPADTAGFALPANVVAMYQTTDKEDENGGSPVIREFDRQNEERKKRRRTDSDGAEYRITG